MKNIFEGPAAPSIPPTPPREQDPSQERARIRAILEREAEKDAARASGPGGQNVNKVSSKAVLVWYPEKSAGFTDTEKALISERMKNEVTEGGYIRRTCSDGRDLHRNLATAYDRFAEAIWKALQQPKERVATKVPEQVVKGRIEDKRIAGKLKSARGEKFSKDSE